MFWLDHSQNYISIHPPRVGRDPLSLLEPPSNTWDFNPPSPCGEGRGICPLDCSLTYFNPPSPCGEGPATTLSEPYTRQISIHPPRVGRDGGGVFPSPNIY